MILGTTMTTVHVEQLCRLSKHHDHQVIATLSQCPYISESDMHNPDSPARDSLDAWRTKHFSLRTNINPSSQLILSFVHSCASCSQFHIGDTC